MYVQFTSCVYWAEIVIGTDKHNTDIQISFNSKVQKSERCDCKIFHRFDQGGVNLFLGVSDTQIFFLHVFQLLGLSTNFKTSNLVQCIKAVYYRATQRTFRPQPSKYFPKKNFPEKPALKKFLIFFQKKAFLKFPEMEHWTFRPHLQNFPLKHFLIFS